jgi:hypothetical protein
MFTWDDDDEASACDGMLTPVKKHAEHAEHASSSKKRIFCKAVKKTFAICFNTCSK